MVEDNVTGNFERKLNLMAESVMQKLTERTSYLEARTKERLANLKHASNAKVSSVSKVVAAENEDRTVEALGLVAQEHDEVLLRFVFLFLQAFIDLDCA